MERGRWWGTSCAHTSPNIINSMTRKTAHLLLFAFDGQYATRLDDDFLLILYILHTHTVCMFVYFMIITYEDNVNIILKNFSRLMLI